MKPIKVEKIPLESLLKLFIELYESGVDYVDLSSDSSDPRQDKLIILTRTGYINPKYFDEERLSNFDIEEDDDSFRDPPTIEYKKLSDDDIDRLL